MRGKAAHPEDGIASDALLVALLQLVRVYGQAVARIADAEVRLFHLYVHEPLMRDGVPGLEMAEEMQDLARDLLPLSGPIMDYVAVPGTGYAAGTSASLPSCFCHHSDSRRWSSVCAWATYAASSVSCLPSRSSSSASMPSRFSSFSSRIS